MRRREPSLACPCGLDRYDRCCGPVHEGAEPATAEALMRARYSAYALDRTDFLRKSWDPATCPSDFTAGSEKPQWIGLTIHAAQEAGDEATVRFTARYRINGRAFKLQETSRFRRERSGWLYVEASDESES